MECPKPWTIACRYALCVISNTVNSLIQVIIEIWNPSGSAELFSLERVILGFDANILSAGAKQR